MYIGIQTTPIVFVDNRTEHVIKDLHFYYDGLVPEFKLKNIKPSKRKLISIYNVNITGEKTLYMNHTNEYGINCSYEIFNQLTEKYCKNILVQINSISEDGCLDIKVTLDYIYNR